MPSGLVHEEGSSSLLHVYVGLFCMCQPYTVTLEPFSGDSSGKVHCGKHPNMLAVDMSHYVCH